MTIVRSFPPQNGWEDFAGDFVGDWVGRVVGAVVDRGVGSFVAGSSGRTVCRVGDH